MLSAMRCTRHVKYQLHQLCSVKTNDFFITIIIIFLILMYFLVHRQLLSVFNPLVPNAPLHPSRVYVIHTQQH